MTDKPHLFSPLTIRGVTIANRIGVSPMCQYSCTEGMAEDWHLVHLGSRAVGGAGIVFVEATSVARDGRITPGDMGLWADAHIGPLSRIARFLSQSGAVPGIQLAHAGRKASCAAPFDGGGSLKTPERGAWQTVAPSALPFDDAYPVPHALAEGEIVSVKEAFVSAARRAIRAGFKVIEIHSAHGYLLHEFLSPLGNKRVDHYGGSLENRMRLALEVADDIRGAIPSEVPLFVRISATDYAEGGWDLEQSIALARSLAAKGVDLIDTSGGGLLPRAAIPLGPGYQVPFASAIRSKASIMTASVGLITEANQANTIISSGDADLVMLAKEMLREPYWALKAALELGAEQRWAKQYGYAVKRRVPGK
jgi:2,4-dienoyl-CoA reductase-like NADH-dependent reductase (Old Yellow Enzyme family)